MISQSTKRSPCSVLQMMPSKMSSSGAASTSFTSPTGVPSDASTGVPGSSASQDSGKPSSIRRNPTRGRPRHNRRVAYDEDLANRIRELLSDEPGLTEQKMFGGLAFLINGNMSVSASGQGGLLLRVDPDQTDKLSEQRHAAPFVMRGTRRRRRATVAGHALADLTHLSATRRARWKMIKTELPLAPLVACVAPPVCAGAVADLSPPAEAEDRGVPRSFTDSTQGSRP